MKERVERFLQTREVDQEIIDQIGYLTAGGSEIFGTNNKNSDTDVRGIVLPSEDYVIGLKEFEHLKKAEGEDKINLQDDLDIELFSFETYFKQAMKGYGIPMEMLFLEKEQLFYKDAFFDEMIQNRNLFLSKQFVKHYLAMNKQFIHTYKLPIERVKNPLSKERIEKFGFETKYASKAVQHFNVLKQLMNTGELIFFRKEREHLLDIKEGRIPLEAAEKEIEELKVEVEEMLKNTSLPERVDFDAANELYKKMIKKIL